MPAPLNRNHVCRAYCTGTGHCIEALALPATTAYDVRVGAARYHEPYGWQVVAVRRAPEAPVATWRAWMQRVGTWSCADDGSIRHGHMPPEDAVAWLVWIAPHEKETHGGKDESGSMRV